MEKSKFIQNSVFLVPLTKKLISFTLLLLLVMIIVGCKKEPLSDRQVTMNLAGDWEFNQKHLLGMWKPYAFVYTKNGKQFAGRDVILSDYTVEITDDSGELRFKLFEIYSGLVRITYRMFYSTQSYFARLEQKRFSINFGDGSSFGNVYNKLTDIPVSIADYIGALNRTDLADYEYTELTHEELKIHTAFEKAYSFIIRNNELIIYFTGIENINLLILKKELI